MIFNLQNNKWLHESVINYLSPICVNSNHWVFLFISLEKNSEKFIFIDPRGNLELDIECYFNNWKNFCKIRSDISSSYDCIQLEHAFQSDEVNCGVCVCLFASFLLDQRDDLHQFIDNETLKNFRAKIVVAQQNISSLEKVNKSDESSSEYTENEVDSDEDAENNEVNLLTSLMSDNVWENRSCSLLLMGQYRCDSPKVDISKQNEVNCNQHGHVEVACYPVQNITCQGRIYDGKTIGFYKLLKCRYVTHYSYQTTVLFSIFLGIFGFDRFYLGYYSIGILKACTFGFLLIGYLVDMILIITQNLEPADGSKYIVDYYGQILHPMKILHNLVTKRFLQRKFTNVKLKYEIDQKLLSSCYILVQIDGLNFKTFTKINNFIKPNDQSNINLMNSCSMKIFETLRDHLIYSYGFSDEFSFVFEPKTKLYDRRYNLYASLISSKFTSYYCLDWPEFFNEKMVLYPNFRSKIFLLPTKDDLISFFEARQLECGN
ncbi:unnamed protein product [Brachionus calyciflorus]|uniref:Probable tRNA(His) guanylyltransferase n=1 Tax=Brachionus calyciflorus TaxID=104777 RepID=A0A814HC89_9BILA|nr:unnamed protein product [Brachionus calyciflorus]